MKARRRHLVPPSRLSVVRRSELEEHRYDQDRDLSRDKCLHLRMAIRAPMDREHLDCRHLATLYLERDVLPGRRRCDVPAIAARVELSILRISRAIVHENVHELRPIVPEHDDAIARQSGWAIVADGQIWTRGCEDWKPAGA